MQCIARAIERLPVTHLNICGHEFRDVFWWNKPLNVNQPVRVFRKSNVEEPISEARRLSSEESLYSLGTILKLIVGNRNKFVDLLHADRVPRFWANSAENDFVTADLVVLGVSICFWATHCIAWHFSFPTHAELLISQISCVAIIAVPPLDVLFLGHW